MSTSSTTSSRPFMPGSLTSCARITTPMYVSCPLSRGNSNRLGLCHSLVDSPSRLTPPPPILPLHQGLCPNLQQLPRPTRANTPPALLTHLSLDRIRRSLPRHA